MIKIAVIGCGRIANIKHFPALAEIEGVHIKYAVDLIGERAEQAKEKYGCDFAETDYHIALRDPEITAVYVLTPNYAHYEITMAALTAGKHVFCEKPITVNYPLSCEMQALANEKKRILNIGVCNRYHRSVELIRKLYEEGALGELYHIYCSFRDYRCIPGLGGDFTTKAKSGGGVLIDWGVHFLDLVMYVSGAKAQTVSAVCHSRLGKDISDYVFKDMWAGPPVLDGINDVEECVTALIRTDKPSISLNGAWAQNINKTEMYVDFLGDKGGIRLDYGNKFTLYTVSEGMLQEIKPDYNIPDMYKRESEAFFRSVETGEKNKGHIDNVIETARVMDAIYESAQKNAEVRL